MTRYGSHVRMNSLKMEEKILVVSILAIVWVIILIWAYCARNQSKKLHKITRHPRRPKWIGDPVLTRKELVNFTIYTAETKKYGHRFHREETVLQTIRRILETHYNRPMDLLPDSTVIISVPMPNFKSKIQPGYFEAIIGEDSGSYEYRMIGDDRIQIAYFVVDEEKYLAGICFYIKDIHIGYEYDEDIIREILNEPVYNMV